MSGIWAAKVVDALSIYKDRRILLIGLMGIASGLPLLLTTGTLSYWLKTEGLDVSAIGLFGAVGMPYVFKPLWAPFIDQTPLPFLTRTLGQRRSWALFIQFPLMAAIAGLGLSDPVTHIAATAFLATLIGFLSASQDIVIDSMRIEMLEESEQGAGVAATQGGYRIGLLIAGAGVILLSDYVDWSIVFFCLSAFMPIGMVAVLMAEEPTARQSERPKTVAAFIQKGVIDPFGEFFARKGALLILIFVLLYKFGDAISGAMSNPFYVDMGYSGTEIALISKIAGVIATMIGIFIGGAMVYATGIIPALVVGGILQAVTNLLFACVAVYETNIFILATAVWGDNFTGGLGSAAFVAFLSILCNRDFTATQYALLTAMTAFGRTLFSTPSGYLVEAVGWVEFFVLTSFLAVPGLLLIWVIHTQGLGRLR